MKIEQKRGKITTVLFLHSNTAVVLVRHVRQRLESLATTGEKEIIPVMSNWSAGNEDPVRFVK